MRGLRGAGVAVAAGVYAISVAMLREVSGLAAASLAILSLWIFSWHAVSLWMRILFILTNSAQLVSNDTEARLGEQ